MDSREQNIGEYELVVEGKRLFPSAGLRRASGGLMAAFALLVALFGLTEPSDQLGPVVAAQWIFALGLVALGLLLILKRPENRFGFIAAWAAIGFALSGTGQHLGTAAADVGQTETAAFWFKVEGVGWSTFLVAFLVLLPLWFPTGKPMSKLWAVLSWAAIFVWVGAVTANVAAQSVCLEWATSDSTCVQEVAAAWGFVDVQLGEDVGLLLILLGLPSVAGLLARFGRSRGVERQQLKWYVSAFASLLGAIVLAQVLGFDVDLIVWPVALLIPASIAVAILKYRLYEIDRIISRTVSYGLIVGFLGLVFAAGAVWLPSTLQVENQLFVAATTLAVAALFNPVRRRIQSGVDRRFNRSRYDTQRVMDEFAGSLQQGVDQAEVVEGWTEVVSETMQPETAGVWIKDVAAG